MHVSVIIVVVTVLTRNPRRHGALSVDATGDPNIDASAAAKGSEWRCAIVPKALVLLAAPAHVAILVFLSACRDGVRHGRHVDCRCPAGASSIATATCSDWVATAPIAWRRLALVRCPTPAAAIIRCRPRGPCRQTGPAVQIVWVRYGRQIVNMTHQVGLYQLATLARKARSLHGSVTHPLPNFSKLGVILRHCGVPHGTPIVASQIPHDPVGPRRGRRLTLVLSDARRSGIASTTTR